jgi:hypothetical protein
VGVLGGDSVRNFISSLERTASGSKGTRLALRKLPLIFYLLKTALKAALNIGKKLSFIICVIVARIIDEI